MERNCLLLVEDDPLVRLTVAMMLEEEGFAVVEAADAKGALGLIKGGLQAGVMVTDVDLGTGPSGPELADELRRTHPAIAIIFITGRAASIASRSLRPREAVLHKPFEGAALSKLVRALAPAQRH